MNALRFILAFPAAIAGNLIGYYLYSFIILFSAGRFFNLDSILMKIFHQWGNGVFCGFIAIYLVYIIVPSKKLLSIIIAGVIFAALYIVFIIESTLANDLVTILELIGGLVGVLGTSAIIGSQIQAESTE